MKHSLLALMAALCAIALPVYGSTSFNFTTSPAGGTFQTTGSSTLNSVTGVDFTLLTVSGDPVAADNGAYTITSGSMSTSGGFLVLSGAIASLGISAPTTLMEVSVADLTTSATGTSSANIQISIPSGITYGSTLLQDLGINNPIVNESCSTCVISSTSGATSGTHVNWTAGSEIMNTSFTETPEPVSFLLMGGGLLLAGGLARKTRKA